MLATGMNHDNHELINKTAASGGFVLWEILSEYVGVYTQVQNNKVKIATMAVDVENSRNMWMSLVLANDQRMGGRPEPFEYILGLKSIV